MQELTVMVEDSWGQSDTLVLKVYVHRCQRNP